jgi:hypothetical protein
MSNLEKFRYNFASLVHNDFVREGEDPPQTFTKEQVEAMIAQEVTGLKSKNSELLGNLQKFKEDLKKFEGIDVAGLTALKEKMDKDEDLKLIAEGKVMEVVEKHTNRMREQHARDLAAKDELIKAADSRTSKYQQAVLDNNIRQAAVGLHSAAVEDALLHARNVFKLDENGHAVQMDEQGRVVLGKDGKSPFSPAEWFEQMKEQKPHWFPAQTSGSGSGDTRQAGGSVKTMKRSDFDSLPPIKQADVAKSGVQIID